MNTKVTDRLGRALRDLRISVTDRCNFRCTYCMPRSVFGPGYEFLHRTDLLSFEEISRLARVFAGLGVQKIRLTGGEPLLRRDLVRLVEQLHTGVPGVELTLTTNGSLLARMAAGLRAAGLDRVTVSLDALEDDVFQRMNDAGFSVADVVAGIEAAVEAGFSPVKINAVIRRGVNEGAIPALAERFGGEAFVVRFIEYMDVGNTNGWKLDEVVSSGEMAARLEASVGGLTALEPNYKGEVARRYRTAAGGEIGIISSVTQPFCRDCNRARLSSDGRLFTCLFGTEGLDLRGPLRRGADDAELVELIRGTWSGRADRYSELRTAAGTQTRKVEMSAIGG
ncbi:MAG: molybdenum cofactor biosynthesis protein MoeA [Verrucomicrobiales bacterium]|nr:molybdenum cofactor biosynthesis protein MoeA [Verrucomicrobiales bacterium]